MKLNVQSIVVLAVTFVMGVGQPLSAQSLQPVVNLDATSDGPIARSLALEIEKLDRSGSAEGLTLADTREAAAAARQDKKRGAIGAIIGAAAGALIGTALAINFATRQCGSSCGDERAMIWVSLIGIPVAGGLAGYHIAK